MIALFVALAVLPPAPARGFILDEAGVLSPGATEVLNRQIKSLSDRGAGQVGILLTNDLRGMTRNELAPKVFKAWGIGYGDRGATGKGRGLLILAKVTPPDRGVRVEVGSDLEGRLNDGKVAEITRGAIPDFLAGRWYDGLTHMVLTLGMEMQIEAADVAAPMRPAVVKHKGIGEWIWLVTAFPAVGLLGLWLYMWRRKRRVPPPRETPMPTLPPDYSPPRQYPRAVYDSPLYVPSPVLIVEQPVVIERHRIYDPGPSYSAPDSSPSSDSGSSWGGLDSGSSSDSGGGFGGGGDSGGGGSDSSF